VGGVENTMRFARTDQIQIRNRRNRKMTMTNKKIRAMIVVTGWLVGIFAIMCAGGAVDGSGSIEQVTTLGLIGLAAIGAAVIAQQMGD